VPATTAPTQLPQLPPEQVLLPGLQMPTAAGPQLCIAPSSQVQPSFGVPLQVASSPGVHASCALGAILQALHMPSGQVCLPFAQLPWVPWQKTFGADDALAFRIHRLPAGTSVTAPLAGAAARSRLIASSIRRARITG
jgi:hypothetical protein